MAESLSHLHAASVMMTTTVILWRNLLPRSTGNSPHLAPLPLPPDPPEIDPGSALATATIDVPLILENSTSTL